MAGERELGGQAYIKEGRLFVRSPGGAPALIIPGEKVKVKVNGEEKSEPVPVREEDRVEIILPPPEEEPGKVEVIVSRDKLQAFLEVKPTQRISYFLPDTPPQAALVIKPETKVEALFPLDRKALARLLEERGVKKGIKEEVIEELYQNPRPGRFLIAVGQPPSPPQDEEVEIRCCPQEAGKPVIRENGTVDYRELQRFPSVTAGSILGVKKPGVPGEPGWGVDGQPIPPRPPREAVLEAGPGAQLAPDGLSVIAVSDGRPVYRRRGPGHYYFAVEPLLKIQGDVNLETGNIRFAGNVRITGNVAEGMQIRAGRSVWVEGEIANALIEAKGDVTVGNVIASTIRAGGPTAFYAKLNSLLLEFLSLAQEALQATEDLQKHATSSNRPLKAGTAFLLLLERKYSHLLLVLKEIGRQVESAVRQKMELPPGLIAALQEVQQALAAIRFSPPEDLKDLRQAVGKLLSAQQEVEMQATGTKARIVARYALNSLLEATGDILVIGQGAYNSILRSGGKVRIDGILRGGKAEALEEIAVNIAGSDLGVKTVISAPTPQKIKLKKAYPGVVIQVGKQTVEIASPLREIKVELSSSGRLEVIGLSWSPEKESV
ncbi:DUF342 domain-containing protein [Ammonifex thiophilus]|uniref:DUF342 domain-containing protein n=1 Tax=Ammonifex thiophilus TaxID=444093 RepID=A0A3D8P410_9THEO|nr:FapA family protein [Ammonifex thiophilus]RDV82112.1 DUF342 domain-containing protein [Ammonifex thiophilus]